MPFFRSQPERDKKISPDEYKKKLENKLCLARDNPEPVFDLVDCNLKEVPSGVYSTCKVLRKEVLYLQENHLTSLTSKGQLNDLRLLKQLNVHSNELSKLPEEIHLLENLEVLNISNNKLRHLPDGLGRLTKLRILNAKDNKIKHLHSCWRDMKSLKTLDLSNNSIKEVPKGMCEARRLRELRLDGNKILYPPQDVRDGGIECIMKFLCEEYGVEYINPENDCNNDDDNDPSDPSALEDSAADSALLESLRRYEQQKDARHAQRVRMEEELEELKQAETQAKLANRLHNQKLIEDLVQEQEHMEQSINNVQRQKQKEHLALLQQLELVENQTDVLVAELMALASISKNENVLQEELEKDRLLASKHEEYTAAQRNLVLESMRSELENGFANAQLQTYRDLRETLAKQAFEHEESTKQELESILSNKSNKQKDLLNQLLEEESNQQEVYRTMLMQSDQRRSNILHRIGKVQEELALLSVLEIQNREAHAKSTLEIVTAKRQMLTEVLEALLNQKADREKQLQLRLHEMEAQNRDQNRDFWILQFQRLIESRPAEVRELEDQMDWLVREILTTAGGEHYLYKFAREKITYDVLLAMTDQHLKELGVTDGSVREAILKEARLHKEQRERAAEKLGIEEMKPSAPPMQPSAPPSSTPSSPTSTTPTAPPSDIRARFEEECVVCMDKQVGVVFLPCGHVCCCDGCSSDIDSCPLCRAALSSKIALQF